MTLARGRVFSLFSFFSFSHTPVFSVSSFFPRPPPKKIFPHRASSGPTSTSQDRPGATARAARQGSASRRSRGGPARPARGSLRSRHRASEEGGKRGNRSRFSLSFSRWFLSFSISFDVIDWIVGFCFYTRETEARAAKRARKKKGVRWRGGGERSEHLDFIFSLFVSLFSLSLSLSLSLSMESVP